MDSPSPSVRDLARRLLAAEVASINAADAHVHEAARLFEKLRISLTRFAGAEGFASLLRRALVLARAELPPSHLIKVGADGSLEGLEELAAESRDGGVDSAVAITAHLLGLLITFIGEPLTMRLVREAWPDATLERDDSGIEGRS